MEKKSVNNFREIIFQSAELYGDHEVFKFKKKLNKKGEEPEFESITYKEFLNTVKAIGTSLLDMKLAGKRVAIISKK